MMWISETDGNLRSERDECVISLRVRARRAPTNAAWSRPPIFGRKNPIGNPFILRAGRQSTHPAASIWLNSHFSTFSSGSRISAKIAVTSQKGSRRGPCKEKPLPYYNDFYPAPHHGSRWNKVRDQKALELIDFYLTWLPWKICTTHPKLFILYDGNMIPPHEGWPQLLKHNY